MASRPNSGTAHALRLVHPLKGHRWGTGQKRCPARARRAPGALTFPLRPSIAFTMDFNIGDKVFYTRSNGVRLPATVVGYAPEGSVHLEVACVNILVRVIFQSSA